MEDKTITHKIYEINLQYLEEKIAKLNKKALKLNCKPFEIKILATELVEVEIEGEDSHLEKVFEVELIGEPPVINGWMFIGTIEHMNAGNIIRAIKGQEFPEKYNSYDNSCEHCHTIRRRKETYLVKNIKTNEFKAVGKSCLKDFLGHNNPNGYAQLMEIMTNLDWMEEFEGIPSGNGMKYINLEEYLSYVALEIRLNGWVSKGVAYEYSKPSTADMALDNMYQANNKYKEEYNEQDEDLALKAIKWAKEIEDKDNNYLHNIHIIALEGITSRKNCGFSASIVSSYTRHLEREIVKEQRETARKQELISDYVGEIGQKIQTALTLLNEHSFDTQWGTTTIYKFMDSEGHVFIWKSSKFMEMEKGNVYQLKGTIKDHSEYNEVKQTILTRCKVIA